MLAGVFVWLFGWLVSYRAGRRRSGAATREELEALRAEVAQVELRLTTMIGRAGGPRAVPPRGKRGAGASSVPKP